MKNCTVCGNPLSPQQIKDQIKPVKVRFFNERQPDEAEVIPYNDWVYEKVCFDETFKLPILFIANFLIHLVMCRCGLLTTKFNSEN